MASNVPNTFRGTKRMLDVPDNAILCSAPPPAVASKKYKAAQAAEAAAAAKNAAAIASKPMTEAEQKRKQKLVEIKTFLDLYTDFRSEGFDQNGPDGDPIVYQYVWFLFKDVIPFFVGNNPGVWSSFRARYDNVVVPAGATQDQLNAALARRHEVYNKYNFVDWLAFVANGETMIRPLLNAASIIPVNVDAVLEQYKTIEDFKEVYKKAYGIFSNTYIAQHNGILPILVDFIDGKPSSTNFSVEKPFNQLIDYFLTTSTPMKMKGVMIPCLLFFDDRSAMTVLYQKPAFGVPLLLFCIYLAYAYGYMNQRSDIQDIINNAERSQYGFTGSGSRVINNIYDEPSDSYFTVLSNPTAAPLDARVCHPASSTIPWAMLALGVDDTILTQGVSAVAELVNRSNKPTASTKDKKIKVKIDYAIVPSQTSNMWGPFSIAYPRRINEVMHDKGWGKRKENPLTDPSSFGGSNTLEYQFITMYKRNPLVCFSILVGYLQANNNSTSTADMMKFISIDPNDLNSTGQFASIQQWFRTQYQTAVEKLMMFNLFFLKYFKQISTQDKDEPSNLIANAIVEPYAYLQRA